MLLSVFFSSAKEGKMQTQHIHNRRLRLSAVMIVRNEQEVISETIESVREIADEIIVWDSGSEDATVSLARERGAKVIHGSWKNDFSAARNECAEKATGDWLLWLDAGEKLSAATSAELRKFIDASADMRKVYRIMVEIPAADSASAGEQNAQPRLLPAKAGLKFEGRVRETLYPSIHAEGLKIDTGPGRIICHLRKHSPARKIQHAQRDLYLLALEFAEQQKPNHRLLLAQGEAYSHLGINDRAREAFIRAIELSEPGSTDMLEGYYGLLTCYNSDPSLQETQIRVCLSALGVFPFDAQLLLAMGNYLQMRGRLDLTARVFESALKIGRVDLSTWHLCELPEVAASCLSMTLELQGKDQEARCVLEEAMDQHPQSDRLQRVALDLSIKQGNARRAIELAKRSGAVSGETDPVIMAIRGACKAAEHQWSAAIAYLQSAYKAGCRSPLCLRWLAVTLLSTGQVEQAKPVLGQWQQSEPNNPELLAYLAAVQEKQEKSADLDTQTAEGPGERKSVKQQYRVDSGSESVQSSPIKIPLTHHGVSSNMPIHGEV